MCEQILDDISDYRFATSGFDKITEVSNISGIARILCKVHSSILKVNK